MFLLGIDIAKLNHVASCIDSSTNEIVFSNFKFKNDFKGFSTLLDKIKTFDTKNLIIGLESTSHYGENLINFLFKQFRCRLSEIFFHYQRFNILVKYFFLFIR